MEHDEANKIAQYCFNVDTESVYNNIFGHLPIRPYSLRRKVARWISDRINPATPARGWWDTDSKNTNAAVGASE